jgi:hypothetical protein
LPVWKLQEKDKWKEGCGIDSYHINGFSDSEQSSVNWIGIVLGDTLDCHYAANSSADIENI